MARLALTSCSNPTLPWASEKLPALVTALHGAGHTLDTSAVRALAAACAATPSRWDPRARAQILMDAFTDPRVDAILDISGGDLANEVLPFLDHSAIAAHPKLMVGYSDESCVLGVLPFASLLWNPLVGLTEGFGQLDRALAGETIRPTVAPDTPALTEVPWAGGNIRFVVQTGGTAQWMAADVIPSDRAARFDIYDEDMFALWEGPQQNMGDPATLRGFMEWGFEQYSAKRYGLVLWNHGSGSINGVCFDELHDFDSLSLAEIGQALTGYEDRFEFIGFDACLMATIETAQAVSPYADYMIASEELEPGSGWNYKAFGSFLRDNPQADGAQLGQVVADSFLSFNQENGDEEISTLSVTRLAAIPALAQAMDAAGWKMLEASASSAQLKDITRGIHRAENYGGNTPEEGYTNMVDIGSMMREIEGSLPEARQVLEALDEAVVYRVAGSGRQQSTGLSVYYPLQVQGSKEYEVFKAASPSEGYRRFVAGMLYGAQSGDAAGYVSQQ